jgi:multidrug efflux pump subunit AcrA (membrane-fusion protein)
MAEDGVRITSGLNPGDLVVVAGAQFLRDRMRVRLPNERQQARTNNAT